ncbi:recombinase family protein [Streptosporangium sp. NPDC023963]|uniref:recombinase family protein n=1 Tax=Streptosporangium sp. NPDC023963 TaxID=3155608 RepID=UPI00341D39DD
MAADTPTSADATPADIVREITALVEAGHTLEEIADTLNENGAPPPAGPDPSWTPASLRQKLTPPAEPGT